MFVRFSKRKGNPENERSYRRAVALNNTYLVQEGENIVAFGRLRHNSRKEYRIWVVSCNHTAELERYVKRFIGNSAKWENQAHTRRRYEVLYVGQEEMNNTKFSIQAN